MSSTSGVRGNVETYLTDPLNNISSYGRLKLLRSTTTAFIKDQHLFGTLEVWTATRLGVLRSTSNVIKMVISKSKTYYKQCFHGPLFLKDF